MSAAAATNPLTMVPARATSTAATSATTAMSDIDLHHHQQQQQHQQQQAEEMPSTGETSPALPSRNMVLPPRKVSLSEHETSFLNAILFGGTRAPPSASSQNGTSVGSASGGLDDVQANQSTCTNTNNSSLRHSKRLPSIVSHGNSIASGDSGYATDDDQSRSQSKVLDQTMLLTVPWSERFPNPLLQHKDSAATSKASSRAPSTVDLVASDKGDELETNKCARPDGSAIAQRDSGAADSFPQHNNQAKRPSTVKPPQEYRGLVGIWHAFEKGILKPITDHASINSNSNSSNSGVCQNSRAGHSVEPNSDVHVDVRDDPQHNGSNTFAGHDAKIVGAINDDVDNSNPNGDNDECASDVDSIPSDQEVRKERKPKRYVPIRSNLTDSSAPTNKAHNKRRNKRKTVRRISWCLVPGSEDEIAKDAFLSELLRPQHRHSTTRDSNGGGDVPHHDDDGNKADSTTNDTNGIDGDDDGDADQRIISHEQDGKINQIVNEGDGGCDESSTSSASSWSMDDDEFDDGDADGEDERDDNAHGKGVGNAHDAIDNLAAHSGPHTATIREQDSENDNDSSQNRRKIRKNFDAWMVLKDEYAKDHGYDYTPSNISSEFDHDDDVAGLEHHAFNILGTSADDVAAHPHVLSPPLMDSLLNFVPEKFSVGQQNFWLKYSLIRDGASMDTLLHYTRASPNTILAIETTKGDVFGCFTSTAWKKDIRMYGGHPSFVWKMRHGRDTKCHSLLDKAQMESELDVFFFLSEREDSFGNVQYLDDQVQFCNSRMIGIGSNGGAQSTRSQIGNSGYGYSYDDQDDDDLYSGFAIALEEDLLCGTTSYCLAFKSPSLVRSKADNNNSKTTKKTDIGEQFEVLNLEVWAFTPCATVASAEKLEMTQYFVQESIRSASIRSTDSSFGSSGNDWSPVLSSRDQFYRRVGHDESDETELTRENWQYRNMMDGGGGAGMGGRSHSTSRTFGISPRHGS